MPCLILSSRRDASRDTLVGAELETQVGSLKRPKSPRPKKNKKKQVACKLVHTFLLMGDRHKRPEYIPAIQAAGGVGKEKRNARVASAPFASPNRACVLLSIGCRTGRRFCTG